MQARTTTSSLGEPQQHTNTPLRALEADQDQDVSPMSHVTAISPHPTNTHKHTAEHLTVTTGAAAPQINPFPNLGALKECGSSCPCPPEDVIPSPRRGGDEIPPPGACARPGDDHDINHGHDDCNVAYGDRARENNRLREVAASSSSSASYIDSLDKHDRNGRHRFKQEVEEEGGEEEEESMAHYEVVKKKGWLLR